MGLKRKRPHTSATKGKRVRIVLYDGTVIIEKFSESTKKHVFLDNGEKLLKSNIKEFGIWRENGLHQINYDE
jgi:hypothetical protein